MAPTPVNMDATHFCARPSGDITSMICVDDLPDGMTIDGAPRKLSPAETQGMTSCGMMPKRPEPWMINHDNKPPVHNGRNGLDQLKSFLYELMEDDAVPSGHRDTIGKLMSEFSDEPIPSNALIKISPTLTTSSNSSYNRRQARGYGRKEYCSYWIRHGECDYQQQGRLSLL
ncbi:Zinc finger CCCH-type [Penicillium herquei]|nr:Zinc finger CCCH-type [Penicillium herquei]